MMGPVFLLLGTLATTPACPPCPCPSPAPARPERSVLRLLGPGEGPELSDDLPLPALLAALEGQIRLIEAEPEERTFSFDRRTLSRKEYLSGLRCFVKLGREAPSQASFMQAVRAGFDVYQVAFGGANDVLVTSYYEPVLSGALRRTERFSQPLYGQPQDLVTVDLKAFDAQVGPLVPLRGRLESGKLLPYYTRRQIDVEGILAGKGLELAWVDPLDAFTLQTEGSGSVRLPDGSMLRLLYANNNGHPHERLGPVLRTAMKTETTDFHSIHAFLRSLPVAEMRRYLNMNARYVFFRRGEEAAGNTTLGVPATDGRTIATDAAYFPKGALAYLVSEKPVFARPGSTSPTSWVPMRRFVLDQDTGGGILGAHLDLYWGKGDDARRHAGVIKQRGRLYYLLPRTGAGPCSNR